MNINALMNIYLILFATSTTFAQSGLTQDPITCCCSAFGSENCLPHVAIELCYSPSIQGTCDFEITTPPLSRCCCRKKDTPSTPCIENIPVALCMHATADAECISPSAAPSTVPGTPVPTTLDRCCCFSTFGTRCIQAPRETCAKGGLKCREDFCCCQFSENQPCIHNFPRAACLSSHMCIDESEAPTSVPSPQTCQCNFPRISRLIETTIESCEKLRGVCNATTATTAAPTPTPTSAPTEATTPQPSDTCCCSWDGYDELGRLVITSTPPCVPETPLEICNASAHLQCQTTAPSSVPTCRCYPQGSTSYLNLEQHVCQAAGGSCEQQSQRACCCASSLTSMTCVSGAVTSAECIATSGVCLPPCNCLLPGATMSFVIPTSNACQAQGGTCVS